MYACLAHPCVLNRHTHARTSSWVYSANRGSFCSVSVAGRTMATVCVFTRCVLFVTHATAKHAATLS